MLKVLDKTKLAEVWRWKFYKLRFEGKGGDYTLVSSDGGKGIVVFAKDKKNNICLLKIYRYAVQDFSWELPRGWVEDEETEEEAGIREFKEELGIVENPIYSEVLGSLYVDSGLISHDIQVLFLKFENFSKYNVWNELDGSYENIMERTYLPLKEFENRIRNNIIKDNFTLAAYSLVRAKGLI